MDALLADPTMLSTGVVVSVLSTEIIQIVKGSKSFPWMTEETEKVNRWVGIVVAFLAGMGIHITAEGNGTIVITGLLWSSIGHGFLQWAQQQLYYRLVVARQPIVINKG